MGEFQMAVTNTGQVDTVKPVVRTQEQFEKVREIVESEGFDFACANPFDDPYNEIQSYTGPFMFTYYRNGEMEIQRIEGDGSVSWTYGPCTCKELPGGHCTKHGSPA